MTVIKACGLPKRKKRESFPTIKMYNNNNQNQNPNTNFPVYPPPPVADMPPSSAAMSAPLPNATDNFVDGPIPDTAFVETPVFIVCPNCNYRGNTRVDRARGCLSFWCYFCCCISLCSECCDDYQHVCPQCKTILGTYQMV